MAILTETQRRDILTAIRYLNDPSAVDSAESPREFAQRVLAYGGYTGSVTDDILKRRLITYYRSTGVDADALEVMARLAERIGEEFAPKTNLQRVYVWQTLVDLVRDTGAASPHQVPGAFLETVDFVVDALREAGALLVDFEREDRLDQLAGVKFHDFVQRALRADQKKKAEESRDKVRAMTLRIDDIMAEIRREEKEIELLKSKIEAELEFQCQTEKNSD